MVMVRLYFSFSKRQSSRDSEKEKMAVGLIHSIESTTNTSFFEDKHMVVCVPCIGETSRYSVKVLSRVNKDINCVFLHLLENPRLCDLSAVEMVSVRQSNGTLTNPNASRGGEKRGKAIAHRGRGDLARD
jgi:hypothetical protein